MLATHQLCSVSRVQETYENVEVLLDVLGDIRCQDVKAHPSLRDNAGQIFHTFSLFLENQVRHEFSESTARA